MKARSRQTRRGWRKQRRDQLAVLIVDFDPLQPFSFRRSFAERMRLHFVVNFTCEEDHETQDSWLEIVYTPSLDSQHDAERRLALLILERYFGKK